MKKMYNFLKSLIFNIFILYIYNLISVNFNLVIPINIVTVLVVGILGVPGLFAMILFKITVLWGDNFGGWCYKRAIWFF